MIQPRRHGRTSVKQDASSVDVLILHGLSIDLVKFLKDVLDSLGVSSDSPLDLASLGLSQDAKVNHYIKSCRLPLVIVSFDEEEPGSKKSRPNVYDEIQRCRRFKKEDVILLQELREGTSVVLPSNVVGQMVVIPLTKLPYIGSFLRSIANFEVETFLLLRVWLLAASKLLTSWTASLTK
jgi:hypothetical protein